MAKPSIPFTDLSKLRYLTLDEAACYLRLTPEALRTRMKRGKVPTWCYSRLGGSLRFIRAALDEWMGADERSQQIAKRSVA
jgi:excisionase family DNA binding protein